MKNWKRLLNEFKINPDLEDDELSLRVCKLALQAREEDCYGVGALIVDKDGEIIVSGHNEAFSNGQRSDLHAEMVVMNALEVNWQPGKAKECKLVTSLEPCPMCMTRLIFSGIGEIIYIRQDDIGGMVHRSKDLPPVFQDLMESQAQKWRQAECSAILHSAAFEIWDETREALDKRWVEQ